MSSQSHNGNKLRAFYYELPGYKMPLFKKAFVKHTGLTIHQFYHYLRDWTTPGPTRQKQINRASRETHNQNIY